MKEKLKPELFTAFSVEDDKGKETQLLDLIVFHKNFFDEKSKLMKSLYLREGVWRRCHSNDLERFKKCINKIKIIDREEIGLSEWGLKEKYDEDKKSTVSKREDETDYLKNLAKKYPNKFLLLDRKNSLISGSQVELADLITSEKDIITVKYGKSASGSISHLAQQACTPGRLLSGTQSPTMRKTCFGAYFRDKILEDSNTFKTLEKKGLSQSKANYIKRSLRELAEKATLNDKEALSIIGEKFNKKYPNLYKEAFNKAILWDEIVRSHF